MTSKKALFILPLFLLAPGLLFANDKIPPPEKLGLVVLGNNARQAGLAPVVFDHWLHRATFTCRLCHIDIGFAMQAGETGIRASLNSQGYYCGACHDGEKRFGGKTIFAACEEEGESSAGKQCNRCHSQGKEDVREIRFQDVAGRLPRTTGNSIDWEKAEADGLVKPADFLEGVSQKRDALQLQADFSIEAQTSWASDVIFSHKKHAVWNGCEVCHPAIYASTKAGTVKYSMFQIYEGESCGVCHSKVAFSLFICDKCHKNKVQ